MIANHQEVKKLLNTAKGQIEGILRMVDDDRYCIDISTQLLATTALLKKINSKVLTAHLEHCVLATLDEEGKTKIAEIVEIIEKLNK